MADVNNLYPAIEILDLKQKEYPGSMEEYVSRDSIVSDDDDKVYLYYQIIDLLNCYLNFLSLFGRLFGLFVTR